MEPKIKILVTGCGGYALSMRQMINSLLEDTDKSVELMILAPRLNERQALSKLHSLIVDTENTAGTLNPLLDKSKISERLKNYIDKIGELPTPEEIDKFKQEVKHQHEIKLGTYEDYPEPKFEPNKKDWLTPKYMKKRGRK